MMHPPLMIMVRERKKQRGISLSVVRSRKSLSRPLLQAIILRSQISRRRRIKLLKEVIRNKVSQIRVLQQTITAVLNEKPQRVVMILQSVL